MDLSHLSVHSVASHGQTRTAWTAQVCACWAGVGAGPGGLVQPGDRETAGQLHAFCEACRPPKRFGGCCETMKMCPCARTGCEEA